jgi:hypothetical protein
MGITLIVIKADVGGYHLGDTSNIQIGESLVSSPQYF